MGIDIEAARFLLARRHEGASFEHCATLGRQHYFLGNKETAGLLEEFGLRPENFPNLFPAMYPPYSEPFWEMLGAKKLVTIDASSFEGAIHVHDMNQPIPAEWQESYDVVCDIGTLEHVFNFPVAIGNCMKMVKRGGHLFLHCPANNFFGHGFYQFSPELFFRVLSPQNGFQISHCVAVEYGLRPRWFTVTDPEAIRARVTLINSSWVTLLVWAKRREIVPVMRETPQQSDYAAAWSETAASEQRTPNVKSESSAMRSLKRCLLESAPRVARMLDRLRFSRFSRDFSFSNRRSFTPISKRH
jgi:hypothetical protein